MHQPPKESKELSLSLKLELPNMSEKIEQIKKLIGPYIYNNDEDHQYPILGPYQFNDGSIYIGQ